jgi:hypothetical protein
MKGRKLSEETKRKMALALRGNKNSLGQIETKESRIKKSLALKKYYATIRQRLQTEGFKLALEE